MKQKINVPAGQGTTPRDRRSERKAVSTAVIGRQWRFFPGLSGIQTDTKKAAHADPRPCEREATSTAVIGRQWHLSLAELSDRGHLEFMKSLVE